MSAIASFIQVPISSLPAIRDAVVPKKKLFGGVKDTFHDVLKKNGRETALYAWSGYVLATLLPFLDEQGVDLMKSEYDEIATFISEKREVTCFILTNAHKKYVARLAPDAFSQDSVRDYYNEFNAAKEAGVGKAMIDGIAALRDSLQSVDEDSVVLLIIE